MAMVTHVVCFKIKDPAPEKLTEIRDLMLSMVGRVPPLLELEVGIDALRSGRSYDLVLIARFASWADLEAYQADPFHQTVLAHMRMVSENSIAVDYESENGLL